MTTRATSQRHQMCGCDDQDPCDSCRRDGYVSAEPRKPEWECWTCLQFPFRRGLMRIDDGQTRSIPIMLYDPRDAERHRAAGHEVKTIAPQD